DELAVPLRTARDAAAALAATGRTAQATVDHLALWLAVLVGALPVVVALAVWLPRRLRWVREARAVTRLQATGGLELLAWRALVNRPLRVLARAGVRDPAGALRAGDAGAVARLAALELSAVGLRLPATGGLPPPR
ncbi:MAG TPA: hypothetical protein VKP64_12925, partial [Mycobacteriales bacterium]|nr:hypothetical protein [Mycobacteriales bacterium]